MVNSVLVVLEVSNWECVLFLCVKLLFGNRQSFSLSLIRLVYLIQLELSSRRHVRP